MAVLYRDEFVPTETYARGLRATARAVLRLRSQGAASDYVCSGLFLAPGIVVCPSFAVPRVDGRPGRLSITGTGVGGKAPPDRQRACLDEIEIVEDDAGGGEPIGIAIARFEPERTDRLVALSFDEPATHDVVSVVGFPEGRRDPALSLGRLGSTSDPRMLVYDAATAPGSAGAAVCDLKWRLIAIHMGTQERENRGLGRATLLDLVRRSSAWEEIARHHRLADDSNARAMLSQAVIEVMVRPTTAGPTSRGPHPDMLRAAVSISVAPSSIDPAVIDDLEGQVADPDAEVWTLRPAERRALLRAAGGLDALRAARGPEPAVGVGQAVVDAVLAGPPYAWRDASDEALGWWLQVVRWFEGIASDLPSPAEVSAVLERRRLRGRLERIAGPGFRGREDDLHVLRAWAASDDGPCVVTGVGGVGKSALVARFAAEQPTDTLLLWLDFDRADLAPDDARSVLSAIAAQVATQVDGWQAPSLPGDWQSGAAELGQRIATAIGPASALLVLDSFEAAQYAERYQELWPVLERICEAVPAMRVIVTGRAPVPSLQLRGRPATLHALKGLAEPDARAWLEDLGVEEPGAVARVLDLADGIPLILKLAARYLDEGGSLAALPADLPPVIVAGYLYDRILDRVQNAAIKPLARGALVLRRLTAPMIEPILGGLVEMPEGAPVEWMAELSREMALVEGGETLRLRSEVRAATLELLERESPLFVRAIDERAAAWYASQPDRSPELAAELVYHRLRLGDVAGATAAWVDGTGAYLLYADQELRDPAARAWLQARLGLQTGAAPADVWEQDAAERVRELRTRRHARAVPEILRERTDRSPGGPLLFHDAFEARRAGQFAEARAILESHAQHATGTVARDRTVLRALLATDLGEHEHADRLLATVSGPGHWNERPGSTTGPLVRLTAALTIEAARVRVALDPEAEARLLTTPSAFDDSTTRVLADFDVVLPALRERLGGFVTYERADRLVPLVEPPMVPVFDALLEEERARALRGEPEDQRKRRHELLEGWRAGGSWESATHPTLAHRLAELGWRRWWRIAHGPALQQAVVLAGATKPSSGSSEKAIVGVMALAAVRAGAVLVGDKEPLEHTLVRHPLLRTPLSVNAARWPRLRPVLEAGFGESVLPWPEPRGPEGEVVIVPAEQLRRERSDTWPARVLALLALVAPDPLESLVNAIAGQPDPPV